MSPLGSRGKAGSADPDEPEKITIKDNRRIDRSTGQVRPEAVQDAAADDVINSPGEVTDGALAAAQAETAERTADLQRVMAEYANYRKRADRDKQAASVAGKASVMAELLAVCDDLERAEEHGDLTGGFKTVADKFLGILGKLGLAGYGAEGDEFDPTLHEAVQFATSTDVDHPTVTTVLRRGYLFDEKVLRAAVVIVTGPEHTDGSGDGSGVAGDGAEPAAEQDAAATE